MRISLHFLRELVRSTTMNLKVEAHGLNRKNLIWNRLEQKNAIEHYSFTISRIILFIKINIFIWLENFRKCFNNDFLTSIVRSKLFVKFIGVYKLITNILLIYNQYIITYTKNINLLFKIKITHRHAKGCQISFILINIMFL